MLLVVLATDGRQPVVPALLQVPLHLTSLKAFLNLVTEATTLVQLLTIMETQEVIGYK